MSDRLDEQVEIDRLGNDRVEPGVHRPCAVFGTRVSGARDRRRPAALVGGQAAHAANQLVAVLARHADV
jgi:hypothetical protein